MIARLFRSKPKLDSKDVTSRLAAIEALSEDEVLKDQTSLIEMMRKDPDAAVRQRVLSRLSDLAVLREYLEHGDLAPTATARVLALNEKGAAGDLADHPRILIARLATDADPVLVEKLAAEPGHLIDAVLSAERKPREAMLAHPVFHRAGLLQELERRSRDRDKTTNRLARTRLDALKKQSAEAEALTTSIRERLSALEKPATHNPETEQKRRTALCERIQTDLDAVAELTRILTQADLAAPKLDDLRARWVEAERTMLSAAPSALSAGPTGATQSGRVEETSSAEPGIESDPALPDPGLPNQKFEELSRAFEALGETLATQTDFDALAVERQRLTSQWLELADQAPPSEAQHLIFEQVSHRFVALAEAAGRFREVRLPVIDLGKMPEAFTADTPAEAWTAVAALEQNLAQLRKALAGLRWPDWAPQPVALIDAHAEADATRARLSAWQEQVTDTLKDLETRLEKLDAHIDAGELKAARSNAGAIRKRLKAMPERTAHDLNRHLGRASARLAELSDWQTFATTPKREALLSAMSEIADTPLAARDQAEKIKDLRRQWNELGPVGRSEDHKLLGVFNAAAERAFEPCRSYFAEQAEERARNLTAREAICESLSEYLMATDWSGADFKAAERIMRTAREEWQRFHPVDRTPGKHLEARFEALQADLHQHIKAEWDRNLEAKRQIVTEAQTLAEAEVDSREKVEGAKRLQQRWKTIGTTPRRPDQTLWREFRNACDAIFGARDEEQKTSDQEIAATSEAAREILTEMGERLSDTAIELDAATLRDFQEKFVALPELPGRVSQPLERELTALVQTGERILRDQRKDQHLARLEGLKAQDQAVSELEQRILAGESVAIEAPDPLFAARSSIASDSPVSAEELARLAIEAEIAAGLESPEPELRMSLQVELMNAGRGRQALEATPEELAARWCRLGPKGTDADPLRDRFFIALGKLLGR